MCFGVSVCSFLSCVIGFISSFAVCCITCGILLLPELLFLLLLWSNLPFVVVCTALNGLTCVSSALHCSYFLLLFFGSHFPEMASMFFSLSLRLFHQRFIEIDMKPKPNMERENLGNILGEKWHVLFLETSHEATSVSDDGSRWWQLDELSVGFNSLETFDGVKHVLISGCQKICHELLILSTFVSLCSTNYKLRLYFSAD